MDTFDACSDMLVKMKDNLIEEAENLESALEEKKIKSSYIREEHAQQVRNIIHGENLFIIRLMYNE